MNARASSLDDVCKQILEFAKLPLPQFVMGLTLFIVSFVDEGAPIDLTALVLGVLGMLTSTSVWVRELMPFDKKFAEDANLRQFSWYVSLASLGYLVFFAYLSLG